MFDYGERMRLRLHFHARRPLEYGNFNVSFVRSDNVACCNYNMAMDGYEMPVVDGRGVVELLVPPLKLVSEMYTIHVMVWDRSFQELHSAQVGRTFHVRHPSLTTDFGIFHEQAEWSQVG